MSSKFYRDEKGRYWEFTGVSDGKNIFVPAPVWAGNVNPYLFEGPNIMIGTHAKPICPDVPVIKRGADPVDGGNLILTEQEKSELLRTDPEAEKLLRPFMMGRDFINRIHRWCLWLKDTEPADIRKCPRVLERIERVREFRLSRKSASARRAADTPALFMAPRECKSPYLAIPKVSSEKRRYIPIGWLTPDIIAGDKLFVCEGATLYQFGILNSSVHMAWVRIVTGRLNISFSYSNTLDYNAFVWPNRHYACIPGDSHVERITQTAHAILDARAKYPKSSLADLYDERTMPPELRKAHRINDEAVMNAYGFERHYEDGRFHDEDIVIRLMYMYKDITGCEEYTASYPNREFWLKCYGDEGDD